MPKKKIWYVALVGRPNSGKSTFLNTLIGEKVGIVSSTPQTTRKSVRWIYTDERCQIVFFDTPGVHESKDEFNLRINAVAHKAVKDADVLVRFIDASRPFWDEERKIDELVAASRKPVVRVFSKWDCALPGVSPGKTLTASSVSNKGLSEVVTALLPFLPEGEPYYDEDYYTDQDPHTRVSEIIREKAISLLTEEIPHDLYVRIEEFEEEPARTNPSGKPLLKILAYLVIERESQKRIVIGKGAEKIREISTLSRMELEDIFDQKIFLTVRVKVEPHWKKNRKVVEGILS